MGADIFGVLLTIVLLGINAFFVGSEFALISARRDRLPTAPRLDRSGPSGRVFGRSYAHTRL